MGLDSCETPALVRRADLFLSEPNGSLRRGCPGGRRLSSTFTAGGRRCEPWRCGERRPRRRPYAMIRRGWGHGRRPAGS